MSINFDKISDNLPWTQSAPLKNKFLTVNTAFTTGSGKDLCFRGMSKIEVRIPPDPAIGTTQDPKGYDYYFHVAIRNEGPPQKIYIYI